MKKPVQKAFALAVVGLIIMLIAGCEEEKLSNTKMSRLIGNENRQLKKQLEQCNKEIKKQKKLLNKCLRDKKGLEGQTNEEIENKVSGFFGIFAETTKEINDENEKLKAQVEELQKEKDNLKDEVMRLKEEVKELRRKPLFRPQPEPL